MRQNFKIVTVFGTRPEIIKLSTLIPVLNKEFNHTAIYTGQHYDKLMRDIFMKELMKEEEIETNETPANNLFLIEEFLEKKFSKLKPDIVLVYGDTNSSLIGARVAKKRGIYLIHIEAGLRCFEPIREELNRIEIDELSDLLLCPSDLNRYFLHQIEQKGLREIEVTGSLIVDVYNKFKNEFVEPEDENYVILTLHREENVETQRLFSIMSEICLIKERIIFPVHPRMAKKLVIDLPSNIKVVKPMDYFQFGGLLKKAKVCITDSGGVQEECLMAETPCITLRRTTERQETIYLGANVLFDPEYGRDLGRLVQEMIEKEIYKGENPYGKGDTTIQIINLLKEIVI